MSRSRSRSRWWLVSLGLVLAIVGHWAYWYSPRVRTGVPGSDLPGSLFAERSAFPLAAWLPHPHQNLAALDRSSGLDAEALRAALRLAEMPEPSLPGFGGLSVPPARSLAVGTDLSGDRFVVMARVYPLFAGFARLSGWLTHNVWLGGGTVNVDGSPLEIAWRGSVWCAGSPNVPPSLLRLAEEGAERQDSAASSIAGPAEARTAVRAAARAAGPGLLWIDVRAARDPIPTGLYRFGADDGVLELASVPSPRLQTSFARAPGPDPGEAVAGADGSGAGGSGAPRPPVTRRRPRSMEAAGALLLAYQRGRTSALEPIQAMALFSHDPTDVAELPRAAVLHDGVGRRWELPAEGLLDLAGRLPGESEHAGWRLVATDGDSLQRARGLAPDVQRLAGPSDTVLELGLWLELERAAIEAGRIRRGFERSPLAGSRQLARWMEAERLLSALRHGHSTLDLEIDRPADAWGVDAGAAERRLRLRID